MGEVYRARDTRLDRTVAIKVLPSYLASDPQLRDRFNREARAISSLQHPHICTLFDVGEAPNPDGESGAALIQFLVLEYLEGETLAERIARAGALPASEALKVAAEVCDALDKAHRSNIVHRDLKPANVMLTKAGAKLLDFGLAKAAAPVVNASGLSMMPTTPPELTAQGAILGTFQYMAPEQIEGLEADARTDIFAFGALLFEMLTGRSAFEGKTRASLLGAILKDDPPHVSAVQPGTSKAIDRIIGICLAKDPDDRYQSARDLLRDLKDAARADAVESASPQAVTIRAAWASRILAIAGGLALLASVAVLLFGRMTPANTTEPPSVPVRFSVAPPADSTFLTPVGGGTGSASQMAVSPDGKQLVFVASTSNKFNLWIRPLGAVEARMLPGTDGASFPFWSPDSRFVGFFAQAKLKKIAIDGGAPLVLCDAPNARGGTWNRDNVILFNANTTGPLQRVSAAGGIPVPASKLDAGYGETNHRFPFFLPDGKHFLFTATVGTCCPAAKPARVEVGDLDSMDSVELFSGLETTATYASGHLLFNRGGVLMARPFDADSRRFTGEPFPVAESVASEGSRYASFAASNTGTLVYAAGAGFLLSRLTWFDRTGKVLGTLGDVSSVWSVALSPDEHRVAVTLSSGIPENRDIWLFDSNAGTPSHFTFDPTADNGAVWSPDNTAIVYQSSKNGFQSLQRKPLDGGAEEELLSAVAGGGDLHHRLVLGWSVYPVRADARHSTRLVDPSALCRPQANSVRSKRQSRN